MIGHTVSHYRIVEKLGAGGMGVVYKAEDTRLHRTVALKFLPQDALASDDARARFAREAQAAASLNHPHIAMIYEFDEAAGLAFIAMEHIDGQTLKAKIRERPLAVRDALTITIDLSEGMAKAHEKGIIHRDIKSENVMISSDSVVKIMDFGLAEITGRSRVTREGSTVGTLAYMSPEQLRGEPLDPRTDIWSAGVLLYEMLTGELPFKAEQDTGLMYLILNEHPPAPSALDRRIPPQVDAIVAKMLEKDRSMRYQNTTELLSALHAVRNEIEAAARSGRAKAIAVLPFENISPEKESDYFSDGLTEELIANLSRLRDVRVVSRTTSMQYKNTKKDIKTIGRELGVRYIVEGSVRRFHDDLRTTAQLIEVETDAQLWAETYKGKLADVFDIQEQVARQIVDALMVKLTPTERVVLAKRATLDPEAFDCNLRARDFLHRRTKHSVHFAIQLFQRATELDPRYAPAYAGLGLAYSILYQQFERKEAWVETAIESGLKALMYDSTLSEAHAALGLAYFNKGLLDDALAAAQKAIELDPGDFLGYWILGRLYVITDRDRDAVELFTKVLEINPDYYSASGDLSVAYERLGEKKKFAEHLQAALQFYPRYLSQHPDDARAHIFFSIELVKAGRVEEAKLEAARALELSPDDPLMLYNAACFYARTGEKDLALATLNNAVAAGFEFYEWIKRDTDLESIRNEPAYVALMKDK